MTGGKKAVLISIKPEWCAKIINGRKTMELRKRFPKKLAGDLGIVSEPFKVYIYCSLTGKVFWIDEKRPINGMVIGHFKCDHILHRCEMANADIAETYSLVKREKILEYSKGKPVYGWRITDLVVYDEFKKLSDFGMKKAPMSWCYIEM